MRCAGVRTGTVPCHSIGRVSTRLSLRLPDGRSVQLGDRTPGGSKNQTRYGTLPGGDQVVVKLQQAHGQLAVEEVALRYARQHGVQVPRVIGSGTAADGTFFLVLSREAGVRTKEPAGWYRLGGDLAALASVPVQACTLPCITPQAFVADHLERLRVVEPLLSATMDQSIRKAIGHFNNQSNLVLTHGDPGSGNYLDNEDGGVILDWETAVIAPFGLDPGRAAFIALLDNGHTGIPEQLRSAVIRGYRDNLPTGWQLDQAALVAATTIAGLQFIHGRHTQPLRPDRTAQMAIDALDGYLSNPSSASATPGH